MEYLVSHHQCGFGQHADLLDPLVRLFGVRVDKNLRAMTFDQTPDTLRSRILSTLEPLIEKELPDLILVQGDTETALAGAMAGSVMEFL